MRRAQSDKGSQLLKNLAYNPSFEAAGISSVLRRNNAFNPSLEASAGVAAVRANLLTNPSAETSSGTVNVRTNLIPNPSFEATSGTATVRTNLCTNPSFETASSVLTTRTNLMPNPGVTTNSTSWTTYGGGNTHPDLATSRVAASWSQTGWAYKVQGSATSIVNMAEIGLGDYSAAVGTIFTGSVYLLASAARKARFRFRGIGGGGDAFSADFTLNATTPTRVYFTGAVPAGATGLSISIKEASTPDPFGASDWIAGSMALVENANNILPYFDGTFAASENIVKTAPSAYNGLTTATGISYAGSTWTRGTAPVGPPAGAMFRQLVNLADLRQGERYTTSVTVANDQAFTQQVTLDMADTAQSSWTIQPGEIRTISVYGSRTNYDSTFRFADLDVSSSVTEARSILIKDWIIEVGDTRGGYYSGFGDFTYAWTGTANASTSIQKATGLSGWSQATLSAAYQSSIDPKVGTKTAGVITKGYTGDGIYHADVAVTVGRSYTASIWVKATSTLPSFNGVLRWKDNAQTLLGDTMLDLTSSLVVGSWVRVAVTGVAPATATKLQVLWRSMAPHTPTVFYVDGSLITESGTDVPYFDGATAAAGDFTYAWSGTANASTSYQQAPGLASWANRWFGNGGGYGSLYQAKGGVSGNYARKLWTNANTGATMDAGVNPTSYISVSPNTPYTISAWVRTSVAQNYNFYIEWKDASSVTIGATSQGTFTAVTANTWTRLSVTGTSPANAATAMPVIGPYFNGLTMPAGSTMDFDNVLFEAAPGMLDYFDGANPIQNWVSNPSFETNTTGWGNGPNWTVAQSTSNYLFGTKSLSLTRNNTTAGNGYVQFTPSINLTAGVTYTYSAYVYGGTGSYTLQARGGATNNVGMITTFTAPGNTWVRKSVTFTPANSGGIILYLTDDPNATPTSGSTIFLDGVMFEQSSTVNPYYEGTGDFTYVWSGTANASTSYQQAPAVVGAGGVSYLGLAYQSKTYGVTSGSKAIRITPTSPSNGDSFAEVNSMLGGYTFKANTTYTISGNRTILAPQTNLNGTTHFRINVGSTELTPTLVTAVANIAGTQRVVARFTTGSGTALGFVRFYNGSYFGGGDVWWDDLLLEEGTTNGQYFDGSNPIQNLISNSNFETNTANWWPNTSAPTLSSDSSQAWIGTKSLKATSTVSSADIAVTFDPLTLAPNTTYTLSWYVYSPDARTAYFDVAAPAPPYNLTAQGSKAVPANTWTRVSGTFTTPSLLNGSTAFYLHHGGGPTAVGTSIWIDAVLLEKATTLNPYYAGLGDFTYSWWGTANASGSNQSASTVAERQAIGGSTTTVYQSSVRALSGTKSGAIFLKGTLASDATIMYPVVDYWTGGGNGQLTSGVKNTWSLWVWVPSGSGQVRLQDVNTGTIGNPNTLYDQWERISVTFTGSAGSTQHILRLRTHTTVPAGTVIWWDNELIEAAPAVGSYFDGSTAATPEFTHEWGGTANASFSTQKVTSLIDGAAYRDSSQVDSRFNMYQMVDESGTKIARWVSPAGSANSVWRVAGVTSASFDYNSIKAGGVYTLFYRWRASGWPASSVVRTQLASGSSQNQVVSYDASRSLNVTGWQEYRRTFTALRNGQADTMLYVSLPVLPSTSTDGIFDIRDWMIVEGEYNGDFIDGNQPLSRWTGAANNSISIGYPQQFLDIAGKPEVDYAVSGNYVLPGGYGDQEARTFYTVIETLAEIYNSSSPWVLYGENGLSDAIPNSWVQLRQDGDSSSSSGTNRLFYRRTGAQGVGYNIYPTSRYVVVWGIDTSGKMFMGLNASSLATDTQVMSIPHQRINIMADSGIQKHFRTVMFRGLHDSSTRQALSRYLGNKYGANVA